MIIVNEISVLQSRGNLINALKDFHGLASEHEIEELMIASDPNSCLQAIEVTYPCSRLDSASRAQGSRVVPFFFKKTYI
jgi:hypothetical protein